MITTWQEKRGEDPHRLSQSSGARRWGGALASLALLGTGCALDARGGADEPALGTAPSEVEADAVAKGLVQLSSLQGRLDVPICFDMQPSDRVQERAWIQAAVTETWQNHSNLRFTGWGTCPYGSDGIVIGVTGGTAFATVPDEDGNVSVALNLDYLYHYSDCRRSPEMRKGCIEAHAVHEIGHALGFNHEHNRHDAPTCDKPEQGSVGEYAVGDYDGWSIMNYCNDALWPMESDGEWHPPIHFLSWGDIETVQTFYTVPGNPLLDLYQIKSADSGRYVHVDGNGNRLANTIWQPDDDFIRFRLERQDDAMHSSWQLGTETNASYRIRVVASDERFWHVDGGGDHLLSTRWQPDDDFTRFYIERVPNGAIAFRLKQTGKYLAARSDGRIEERSYTAAQLANATEAHFTLEPVERAGQWNGGPLVNQMSHRCLDVVGAPGTANGTVTQLYDCEAGDNAHRNEIDQNWRLTKDGFLQNLKSSRCLDISGNGRPANGARAQIWNCEFDKMSTTDQRWRITSGGYLESINYPGKCLDVSGSPGTGNKAKVQAWDCEFGNANSDQRWFGAR